jgi:hypothetical protein
MGTTTTTETAACAYCAQTVPNTDPLRPVHLPETDWRGQASAHAPWCEWVERTEARRARAEGREPRAFGS